jgi:MFS family permease
MRLVTAGIILVVAATLMIAFTHEISMIIAASILFGVGMAISTQILQVIIMELVPESRRGVANSTYMLFGDIGMGIGAAIWGVTSVYGGYTITFILSALVIALAAATHVIYLIPKYKNILKEVKKC